MLIKALRPSRHVFLTSAAVSLLVGGMGRTAAAKDCTTDSDCDTGYQCSFGQAVAGTGTATGGATSVGAGPVTGGASVGTGGAGGSAASPGAGVATASTCAAGTNCATLVSPPSSAPVPATDGGAAPLPGPDAGLLPPISVPEPVPTPVTGICEPKPIVCTTVADCPSADFDCVMDVLPVVAPSCPAGTKCETPPPQTGTTGTCVAKPHACSTAADCPTPLVCQANGAICSGGATGGAGGTVTTTADTCTPGPSVCTYVPVTCTTDSDCADPLYQCVEVSEEGWCSGSGGACAAGETCPAPTPPTCGTTVIMNCMPKPIDCGSGQACPAGWSCFDFSNYDGGVRPTWSPNAPDKSCLPDGIILATQGHASDGGQFTANSGSSGTATVGLGLAPGTGGASGTSSDSGAGPVSGQPASTTPSPVTPVPPSTANAAADGGTLAQPMGHSSGCAYGGSDAGQGSLWLALGMTGLIARLARRRRGAR
ncbi:MAG: hypothetical protein ABSF35_08990 [Polyangia bacterium]